MKLLLLCFAAMCLCAWATPVIDADGVCHQDRLRLCPHMAPPYYPQRVFTAPCFLENTATLAPRCRVMFDAWIAAHPPKPVPSQPLTPADGPGHHPSRPHHPHPHRPHMSLEQACRADRMRYCPLLHPPITPKRLFTSPCFQLHKNSLSVPCREKMDDYLQEHAHPEHYHHTTWFLRWIDVFGSHRMYLVAIFMGLSISLALSAFLCLGLACCLKWIADSDDVKKQKKKKSKKNKTTRVSTQYQAIPQHEEDPADTAPLTHEVRFTPAPMDLNSYMYSPYYTYPHCFVPPPNPVAGATEQQPNEATETM